MNGDRDVEPTSKPDLGPDPALELERARALDTDELADAIESVGFECTRCGACCTSHQDDDGEREEHTATVFPDEVRELRDSTDEWRDVARPIPYGLREGSDGVEGETFEWALQTDSCGDCVFYAEDEHDTGECTAHANRPLICQTYPFSIALEGTSQPMGETVDCDGPKAPRAAGEAGDSEAQRASGNRMTTSSGDITERRSVSSQTQSGDSAGLLRVHECEGLGREIDRDEAEALAATLKERTIRELEEIIAVRDAYEPVRPARGEIVVHDSEGTKHPDGTPR